MSPSRLRGAVGARTARRLVDAAFAAALLAALAWCYRAGVPPVALAVITAASVALELVVSGGLGDSLRADAQRDADSAGGDTPLSDVVRSVAGDMGIAPPRIVDADPDIGVNVLRDSENAVLLLSGSLLDGLDDASARAVIAHELAHVKRRHLRRAVARDAVTHVVGLAVCWTVLLDGQWSGVALVGGLGVLVAGVFRANPINMLFYVAASLGAVLPLLALGAKAGRLEECEADDLAVAHTSAADFCTGLYRVATSARDAASEDAVAGPKPFADRRTLLERLTAGHPTMERRLARQGVGIEDVREAADAPVEAADD